MSKTYLFNASLIRNTWTSLILPCFLKGFPLTECILNWGLMDCFKPPQIVNYPMVTPAGEEWAYNVCIF